VPDRGGGGCEDGGGEGGAEGRGSETVGMSAECGGSSGGVHLSMSFLRPFVAVLRKRKWNHLRERKRCTLLERIRENPCSPTGMCASNHLFTVCFIRCWMLQPVQTHTHTKSIRIHMQAIAADGLSATNRSMVNTDGKRWSHMI
jgi:hypothetical protein